MDNLLLVYYIYMNKTTCYLRHGAVNGKDEAERLASAAQAVELCYSVQSPHPRLD